MKNLKKRDIRDILLAIHQRGRLAKLGGVFSQSGLRYAQGRKYKAVEQNTQRDSAWSRLVKRRHARLAWIFENDGGYAGFIATFKTDGKIHLVFQDLKYSDAKMPTGIEKAKAPTLQELEQMEVDNET